jgi:hypothetical protein
MNPSAESPSTKEILASLLNFFAASPEEQSRRLGDYRKTCDDRGMTRHLHDPLVELAEALYEYGESCTTTEGHPAAFFVGPLPPDVVSVTHELSSQLYSMLRSNIERLFVVECLNKAQWQAVRELAGKALTRWGSFRPAVQLGLYELMCHVAD